MFYLTGMDNSMLKERRPLGVFPFIWGLPILVGRRFILERDPGCHSVYNKQANRAMFIIQKMVSVNRYCCEFLMRPSRSLHLSVILNAAVGAANDSKGPGGAGLGQTFNSFTGAISSLGVGHSINLGGF